MKKIGLVGKAFGNNGQAGFGDFVRLNFSLVKILWPNPLTMLPLPPIEARLIDTTISLNKLAMITRRKCDRMGDKLTTLEDKDNNNKSTINCLRD